MALSDAQVRRLRMLMGSSAYDLFLTAVPNVDPEMILLEDNKGNLELTAADMLTALADVAAQVREVKVGPITIKLDPAAYLTTATRLRKANKTNVLASFAMRTVGMP